MKITSTLHHSHKGFLMCALILVLFTLSVQARGREQSVFDVVPEPLRAQLIERLKLYVEYQRTRQYEKLYDLYSRTTIERVFKNQTRDEFVLAFQKGDAERISVRIMDFSPTSVEKTTKENADLYNIYGKAKLCQQGEMVEGPVVIGAQLENGVWHFSAPADVVEN